MVEQGEFVEAMERFYAEDAVAQENNHEPRRGLAALLEHERKTLARFRAVRGRAAFPLFVADDRVVINWIFDFDHPAGMTLHLEELVVQEWVNGKMQRERFFYDPAQLLAPTADGKA